MTLKEILPSINQASFNKHGTDKESCHNYISNFYEREMLPYKDGEINLLEIGIYTGDSLLMWRKYFQKANIYGIDSNAKTIGENLFNTSLPSNIKVTKNGINYVFGNAYDMSIFENLPELFDIIIDDGPHSLDSQMHFIDLYLPRLKQDGLMVIEDIHHGVDEINLLMKKAEEHNCESVLFDMNKLYNSKILKIIKK